MPAENATNFTAGQRAAMFIAHPSHELRVFGWLHQARPLTFVLTDGSGRSGLPRLGKTSELLESAGSKKGTIFGRMRDLEVYEALLRHDHKLFIDMTDELAEALAGEEIDYIAGDASEGVNVSHEACRLMIGAAAEKASRMTGRSIANYDFIVVGDPDDCPEEIISESICIELDQAMLLRKIESARLLLPMLFTDEFNVVLLGEMLEASSPLSPEEQKQHPIYKNPDVERKISGMLNGVGIEDFIRERLRPAGNREGLSGMPADPPFFETYGEKLVAEGIYREVIRYHRHLLPLGEALWDHIG